MHVGAVLRQTTAAGQEELTTKHWQQKQHIWITEIFLIRMLYKDCYWSSEHLTSLILNLYMYAVYNISLFSLHFSVATLFGLRYDNLILNEYTIRYDTIRCTRSIWLTWTMNIMYFERFVCVHCSVFGLRSTSTLSRTSLIIWTSSTSLWSINNARGSRRWNKQMTVI